MSPIAPPAVSVRIGARTSSSVPFYPSLRLVSCDSSRHSCISQQFFDEDIQHSGKLLDAFALCHLRSIEKVLDVMRLCMALGKLPIDLKDHFLHVIVKPRQQTATALPPSQAFSIANVAFCTLASWTEQGRVPLDANIANLVRSISDSNRRYVHIGKIVILFDFHMLESACPDSPGLVWVDTMLTEQVSIFADPSPSLVRQITALMSSAPRAGMRSLSLDDIERVWLGYLKDKVRRGHMENQGIIGKLVRYRTGWKWRPLSMEAAKAADYSEPVDGLPLSLWEHVDLDLCRHLFLAL